MATAVSRVMDGAIFFLTNLRIYVRHWLIIEQFCRRVGYLPNAARPLRYAEKMLWRKLFDHNPLFVTFCDKLATREFVSQRCPELMMAEILWTGDDVRQLPARVQARPCVIKASHGSGYNVYRRRGDADGPPTPAQVRHINGWLRKAYGQPMLEWAYRLARRKLFAEALIVPAGNDDLIDLAVHATDGTPLFIEAIVCNKTARQRKGYFRIDGRRWPEIEPVRRRPRKRLPLEPEFRLPPSFHAALKHAEILSAGVDYARFDFIAASGQLYGGEITVYPGSGLSRHKEFRNHDEYLAAHWDLSKSWFFTARHRGWQEIYAGALDRFLHAGSAKQ